MPFTIQSLSFLLLLGNPAMAQDEEEAAPAPVLPDLTLAAPWTLPPAPPVEGEEPAVPLTDDEKFPFGRALVNIPGLPVDLVVPQTEPGVEPRWKWTANDSTSEIRLGMRASEAYSNVRFRATNFQPDVTLLEGEILTEELALKDQPEADLDLTLGEWQPVQHPDLGPMQVLNFHAWDGFLERDLYYHVFLYAVEGHAVIGSVESSESLERAQEVAGEIIGMTNVVKAPFDPADLGLTGTIEAEAGYSITLPQGMRALSEEELNLVSGGRLGGDGPLNGKRARLNIIRTDRLYDNLAFRCRAEAGSPLEVLDPEKSAQTTENFRAWAKAVFSAGQAKVTSAGEDTTFDFSDGYARALHTESTNDPEFLELDDGRDAYLWKVTGDVYAVPHQGQMLYTAYADVALTCMAIAEEGESLKSFEQAVRGLTIALDENGEPYPMPLSLQARYTRWWPTGNPFLQLYWLPVPLMLIAGYLVLKD
jgi:hypothetical protein